MQQGPVLVNGEQVLPDDYSQRSMGTESVRHGGAGSDAVVKDSFGVYTVAEGAFIITQDGNKVEHLEPTPNGGFNE
jgi:hypothetical protein